MIALPVSGDDLLAHSPTTIFTEVEHSELKTKLSEEIIPTALETIRHKCTDIQQLREGNFARDACAAASRVLHAGFAAEPLNTALRVLTLLSAGGVFEQPTMDLAKASVFGKSSELLFLLFLLPSTSKSPLVPLAGLSTMQNLDACISALHQSFPPLRNAMRETVLLSGCLVPYATAARKCPPKQWDEPGYNNGMLYPRHGCITLWLNTLNRMISGLRPLIDFKSRKQDQWQFVCDAGQTLLELCENCVLLEGEVIVVLRNYLKPLIECFVAWFDYVVANVSLEEGGKAEGFSFTPTIYAKQDLEERKKLSSLHHRGPLSHIAKSLPPRPSSGGKSACSESTKPSSSASTVASLHPAAAMLDSFVHLLDAQLQLQQPKTAGALMEALVELFQRWEPLIRQQDSATGTQQRMACIVSLLKTRLSKPLFSIVKAATTTPHEALSLIGLGLFAEEKDILLTRLLLEDGWWSETDAMELLSAIITAFQSPKTIWSDAVAKQQHTMIKRFVTKYPAALGTEENPLGVVSKVGAGAGRAAATSLGGSLHQAPLSGLPMTQLQTGTSQQHQQIFGGRQTGGGVPSQTTNAGAKPITLRSYMKELEERLALYNDRQAHIKALQEDRDRHQRDVTSEQACRQQQFVFGNDALGTGAYSVVKLARRIDAAKPASAWCEYAMKIVSKALVEEQQCHAAVEREREALELLREQKDNEDIPEKEATKSNKGIVQLCGSFEDAKKYYFVMELCRHGDCFDAFVAPKHRQMISLTIVRMVVQEIADALHRVHTIGYVFADLKLENVLIGNDGHLRLCDFGSCLKLEASMEHEGFAGTAEFLAPELVVRSESKPLAGMSLDWWALGCVLFQLVFGFLPFRASSSAAVIELVRQFADGSLSFEKLQEQSGQSHKASLEKRGQAHTDAVDLIKDLLAVSPTKRANYAAVIKSKFLSVCPNEPNVNEKRPRDDASGILALKANWFDGAVPRQLPSTASTGQSPNSATSTGMVNAESFGRRKSMMWRDASRGALMASSSGGSDLSHTQLHQEEESVVPWFVA